MRLFTELDLAINDFTPTEPPILENVIEDGLYHHLKGRGFDVTKQVTKKKNRYDLIVKKCGEIVCVEMKIHASTNDVRQFDRYLKKFKDGMIVVCWQCSFPMKSIFSEVKEQSPYPIALIELSKKFELV